MHLPNPKRIWPKQAAEYLGISPSTLAKWRMRGTGPRFHRIGNRRVYYIQAELDAWLQECDQAPPPRSSISAAE